MQINEFFVAERKIKSWILNRSHKSNKVLTTDATFVCHSNSGTSWTKKVKFITSKRTVDIKHYFVYDSIWMFFLSDKH